MRNRILLLSLCLTFVSGFINYLHAQCNSLSLVIPDSLCLSENLAITNNTAETFNYQWDFCPATLENNINEVSTTAIGVSDPFGVEYVKDGTDLYVFILHRNSNKLVKVKFSGSFESSATITDLGNIDGVFAGSQGISIYNEGGNWYGLATNRDNKDVVLIDFGASIDNNSPTASVSIANGVDHMRSIEIVEQDSELYAVVAGGGGSGQVFILKYGSSLTNTPTTLANSFSAGNFPTGLAIYRDCENWYGLSSGDLNNRVYKFSYGSDIENTPVVEEMIGISQPRGVSLNKDFGKFYGHVISNSGDKLYRINFNEDYEDSDFEIIDEGSIGASNIIASYSTIKYDSSFYSVVIGRNELDLVIKSFDENCGVNDSYDESDEPSGIIYDTSGWKQYEITYTDTGGLIETIEDSVYVRFKPVTNFSVENKCTGQSTSFTDLSTTDNLAITDWLWDFDDPGSGANNTSSLQNPTHIFSTPGTYNVSLEVTDACGQSTTNIIPIDVVDGNDLQADFSSDPLKCSNAEIQFTDETTFTTDTPETWLWDFDGLGSSTAQNPTFTFIDAGDYDITLTVTGESGCSQVDTQTITIIAGPSPNFVVSDGCVGTLFDFSNTTTGDNIVSYQWDFDNGFMSSEENPAPFEYDSPGTFNVTLTTQNAGGCITSIEKSLTVYDPPVVDFSNELSCELDPTQFNDLSTVNNANIESWNWDFDDPSSGSNSSIEQNPQHVFSQSGDYNVKLITTTTFGCIDSLTQTVSVNQAPSANFSFDKVCIGEEIQFQDESEAVPGEQLTNWAWNLGGAFSAQQNPTATFEFAIDYNVSLTVTSQNLCANTVQEVVTVYPATEVGFEIEDACENTLVHLFDTTEQTGDPIASRFWQLPEQQTATDSSIYYDFLTDGDYDISLIATTERGCEYVGSQNITINEAPEASFEASNIFGAPPLTVDFTNTSNQSVLYNWDFGDGNNSDNENPSNTFTDEGSYNVKLAIEDANGCRDTANLIINALVPELELELIQVTIVDKNIVLTMINNGTLSIDSMQASVNMGDRLTIEEDIILPLPASNNPNAINYTLDLNLASRNIDYVCVTLNPILNGAEDANQINNTKCKNFDSDIIFIKPYPNPAKDQLNVTVMSETDGIGTVRIVSSIGEIVLSESFDGVRGKNDIALDVSYIKAGVYLVEVEMAGFKSNSRVAIDN